jgi:putative RecB family exonuclease
MEAGTLVHDVLERLLDLEPDERTRERARDLYAEEAAALADRLDPRIDRDDLRARAGAALANYFEQEQPALVDVVPEGLERKVSATLDGVPIAGLVDRLEFAAAGARVLDYKTGGAKPRYAGDYWRQVLLYARMLGEQGTDVAEVALMYLGSPARTLVRPTPPQALDRVQGDLVRAQGERLQAHDASAWPARPGPLCQYCPYRSACPAVDERARPTPGTEPSHRLLEASPDVMRRVASTPVDDEDVPLADLDEGAP